MTKRPRILITNDDGIYAPGIKHLWNAVKDIADLTVVAPAGEQSAVSLSITIRYPLRIEKIEWPSTSQVWSVNGTPSDCVKLALSVILSESPNLILSGINRGTNAGRNVFYSGTVAAIIEGIMHDIPGIAFSLGDYYHPRFDLVEQYVPQIVHYALRHPLPKGTFLNVNFPYDIHQGIKGIRMARQGKQYWAEDPEERHHPSEKMPYYWLGAKLAHFEEEEESDVTWLQKGYATAVPIHIGELTDRAHINNHKRIFEDFVN
jgi:5'-nucleotidase